MGLRRSLLRVGLDYRQNVVNANWQLLIGQRSTKGRTMGDSTGLVRTQGAQNVHSSSGTIRQKLKRVWLVTQALLPSDTLSLNLELSPVSSYVPCQRCSSNLRLIVVTVVSAAKSATGHLVSMLLSWCQKIY